jgi:hypothetical protein
MTIDDEFEYSDSFGPDGYFVEISKLGGGTTGQAYSGSWLYRVSDPTGLVLGEGVDFFTGTPKTHAQAAREVIAFFDEDDES